MKRIYGVFAIGWMFIMSAMCCAHAAAPLLDKGDFLVIAGDSITEQLRYSAFIETYLTACHPELDVRVFQLGWSGETTPMFAERMNNDLLALKPDCVTYLYGVNDASYTAYTDAIGKNYHGAIEQIVTKTKQAGLKMVLASPTAVDTFYWNRPGWVSAADYNASLARLTAMAQQTSQDQQVAFNDVYGLLLGVMAKSKAAYGEKYSVTGNDGIHPFDNGHLVIAYSFLKALGVPSDLGRIEIDMDGAARASEGHRLVSISKGSATLQSTRYPFCFYGDGRSPDSTLSVLPFLPFNQDLNRLTLTVTHLKTEQARVTWGGAAKTFSRQELESGINLAEQFPVNPFCEPFKKVLDMTVEKQRAEALMTRHMITGFRLFEGEQTPQIQAAIATLRESLMTKDQAQRAKVRAAIVPVQHTIRVEGLQ